MALRLTRRTIYGGMNVSLAEHLPYEVANVMICIRSEDAKELRRANAEKRKPVFQGR
jgi:enoyl-CoA hydratase/carnithine racemase